MLTCLLKRLFKFYHVTFCLSTFAKVEMDASAKITNIYNFTCESFKRSFGVQEPLRLISRVSSVLPWGSTKILILI